ncbi:f-box domain-containing protein [Trichonephila clavata]|uniref:F-box domain-containing protein n=1 Tax=Trichonephila clavata TaxID=2740835 RepID=A0A8X6FZD7_TRICU|nr:f-box domain-containing protein [Trichonephila clavata]
MERKDISVSSLPDEVLIYIFGYLNVRSRLTACLVCKEWLHFINFYKLLHDVKVHFSMPFQDAVKCSRMTRQFEWFAFVRITISDSVVDFLKQYSKQFVGLIFVDCKVLSHKRKSKYRERFLKCDNLKYLETENSDVIALFAFFPNVTTLMIHGFSGLTDYTLCQLNKTLFKLEMFSLSGSVIYNKADYEKFYVNGETIEANPSKSVLSFASVKKFIEKHKNTMKQLNLSLLQLSPETVVTISTINGLKLKNVSFPSDLPSSFIKKFCENQISLTSLKLTSTLHVNDETVSAVCKSLSNLKDLFIYPNSEIDKSIVEILQLEHLEVLHLDNSKAISELSYQQAVLKLKAFKLKELSLVAAQIADKSLCELLKRNLNIGNLDISHTSVSNETLNMICRNLINLESLTLASCKRISDPGITGEFEDYSNFLTPTPISNLKNLRKLNMNCNPLLTIKGCIKAIKFPNLRSLYLLECDFLNFHNPMRFILEKQNPRLFHFVITFNPINYVKVGRFHDYF